MINFTSVQEREEKDARIVTCPTCSKSHRVHYFSWTGVTCYSCKRNIETYTWKESKTKVD